MSPATIDFILGVVLALFAFKGLTTGLIRSLISLGAVIVAWVVASTMPEVSAPLVTFAVAADSPAFPLVTRLVTWVGAFAVVQLAGFFVAKTVEGLGLGMLDKLGGLVLGVATGVLIGCLPLFVINAFPPLYQWAPAQQMVKESFFLRTYQPLAAQVVPPPASR